MVRIFHAPDRLLRFVNNGSSLLWKCNKQMINGGLGPVLTFQSVLYELSKNLDIPFLSFNAWVGIWIAVYMLLAGFMDLHIIIKYATRFTDEVFAFLIVSIFILDAIGNPTSKVGLFHYFNSDHPHNDKQEELDDSYDYMTVALLSIILGLGTAFFAIGLRKIRYSGESYNYDTGISALMMIVVSILGLPWLVASTVPCIMHVTAMSEQNRHGETESIQESRLTVFFTHVLLLGSIPALSVIKLIPLPVLYGVFLFMGWVALPAQQFWQRFLLFFQQPSKIAGTPLPTISPSSESIYAPSSSW
jgi:amino acid transporter